MRTVIHTIVALAWALWFGGLIALFVVATATFRESHELGRAANPVMFRAFEPYVLVVSGVATVGAVAWMALGGTRVVRVIAVLFVLSAAAANYAHFGVSRRMQTLPTSTPEWRALHGRSMMMYTGQSALLGFAGCVLPVALRGRRESSGG